MKLETSIEQTITDKIDELWQEQLDFLKTIVRFPTISGRERVMQLYLADYFSQNLKMKVDRFTPDIDKIANHPAFLHLNGVMNKAILLSEAKKGSNQKQDEASSFKLMRMW